jgi:L-lactate dehydrogenase (cytochrome)
VAPPTLSPVDRRLSRAFSIGDLRQTAKRVVPGPVFDYVDGGAEEEVSLRRSRSLFRELEFVPSVLHDVSTTSIRSSPLGVSNPLPFALAPTGFTRLMHHEGESAVARAAQYAGLPYALSTMGTTTIEGVAHAAPAGRHWFQLYVWRDRGAATELVERAAASGYEALMLTVDVPVAGARLRDSRNGFAIPPRLTPSTLARLAGHPGWWMNLLTTDPLTFASLDHWGGTVADLLNALFDPTMTIDDLAWLRSIWPGPLIVKGVQSVDDARRVVQAGADAVVVSNHGGRQLDRAPVPLRLLPDVCDAVGGEAEVWMDTGVLNGADIIAAYALGARQVLVGRAYLYGLMAGGERGVGRAIEILASDAERTLKLLGVASMTDLGSRHVRLP